MYLSFPSPSSLGKKRCKNFFKAADEYTPSTDERYKEIEFALPNELDLKEQIKIVERFINKHLKDFYYAYAIHDKEGAMSDGEHHPHVHIMFSTKELDDIEKNNERPPEKFFKRANRYHPTEGGPKKAEKFTGKKRNLKGGVLRHIGKILTDRYFF